MVSDGAHKITTDNHPPQRPEQPVLLQHFPTKSQPSTQTHFGTRPNLHESKVEELVGQLNVTHIGDQLERSTTKNRSSTRALGPTTTNEPTTTLEADTTQIPTPSLRSTPQEARTGRTHPLYTETGKMEITLDYTSTTRPHVYDATNT